MHTNKYKKGEHMESNHKIQKLGIVMITIISALFVIKYHINKT